MASKCVSGTVKSIGTKLPAVRTRCKLPQDFVATLQWENGKQQDVHFFYHAQGAERDAYVGVDAPLVLKLHPERATEKESTNYLEWITATSETVLPLPACYGHFVLDIGGTRVQALLCERIAFTMMEYYSAVSCENPTRVNVQMFAELCSPL